MKVRTSLILSKGRGRMSYSGYQVKGHTFSRNNKGSDKFAAMDQSFRFPITALLAFYPIEMLRDSHSHNQY